MSPDDTLAPFLLKLERRAWLGTAEKEAVLGLPYQLRSLERGSSIIREGESAERCHILLSGFAFSSRCSPNGARAVLALHMDGEALDISGCTAEDASCDVQALTSIRVADVSRESLWSLAHEYPQIGVALWRLTARSASVLAEWLVNVGRRDARGRLSHLICEIAQRQKAQGICIGADYVMPLTQEQLGDSTGLTSVHVNRVMQGLRKDLLIRCEKGRVSILDWERLKREGDFRPGYLQLAA